jgi:hypothetical protein
MNVAKQAILLVALTVTLAACSREAFVTPNNSVVSMGKECPSYSFAELGKFSRFEATLLDKDIIDTPGNLVGNPQITNHSAVLLLEKEGGAKLFAIDKHASDDVMRVVNSLEKGNSYFFPDVLTNRNWANITH